VLLVVAGVTLLSGAAQAWVVGAGAAIIFVLGLRSLSTSPADLQARNNNMDAARQTLDAALVAAEAHDDLWWLPEVMRMRAAYDEEQAAVSRLRSAAQTASAQGSVALLRRCEHDLAEHGVRP
jgi:hypothetical protein